MKQNHSDITFILDMTGSMAKVASEAVDGLNNFIEKQKKVPGTANFSMVTFNSVETKKVFDNVNLVDMEPMSHDDYVPNHMTPLLDTLGNEIHSIGERLKNLPEEERPDTVIVAIMTDGEENFSKKFNRKQIFDMVTHQRKKYNWKFVFLGANQDSYAEAGGYGIDLGTTHNYDHTKVGTMDAYSRLSATVTSLRTNKEPKA